MHNSLSMADNGRGDTSAVRWRSSIVIAVFFLGVAGNAQAYLDPGTGSIILQGLIAAVAAVVTYAGLYWQKVKAFFSHLRGKRKPGQAEKDSASADDSAS